VAAFLDATQLPRPHVELEVSGIAGSSCF
jgi:hypothetical protein